VTKVAVIIVSYYCDTRDHSAGFRTLLLEDQMAALKSSFMELSILRLAFRCVDTRQYHCCLCFTFTRNLHSHSSLYSLNCVGGAVVVVMEAVSIVAVFHNTLIYSVA